MGFYIRKGFNFGPLRLNLSRSGLGASFGVKGARIGVGPRGSYIHLGRGGLYYRQTLGQPHVDRPPRHPATEVQIVPEVIDSGDVERMSDASSTALLAELSRVQRRWDLFPLLFFVIITIVGILASMAWNYANADRRTALERSAAPIPLADILRDRLIAMDHPAPKVPLWWWLSGSAALLLVAGVPLLLWARNLDVTRGTAVIKYDLEPAASEEFKHLTESFTRLSNAGAVWHVTAQAATSDWKRHAGASGLLERNMIRPKLGLPRRVECNLVVPSLPAGRQTLYFFPDRVLVYEGDRVGAVNYDQLSAQTKSLRFREEGQVPSDAHVVGSTWKFVNRNGGPDRRFRNNYEIPIVGYSVLGLGSESGLLEMFQCSNSAVTEDFATMLNSMRRDATRTQQSEASLGSSKPPKSGETLGRQN